MSINTEVAIIGPYRYHNFGDDLIGAVMAKYLQNSGYKALIPGLSLENSKWLELETSPSVKFALVKSKHILIGGGGILGDSGVKPDNFYLKKALKASFFGKLTGKKVIISGVGAGPLSMLSSRFITKLICALSSKVGVRDGESKKFLIKLGIKESKIVEGADIALLWNDVFNINKIISKNIAIQFDINSFLNEDNQTNGMIAYDLLRNFIFSNKDISILTNGIHPSQIFNEKMLPVNQINYSYLPSFLTELSSKKAILTSHLHLAIAAYAARVPCFSIYVRQKTKRFYEQIGHPERAIYLNDMKANDFRKILRELRKAKWTKNDELRLNMLKTAAKKLVDFKNLL